jgi:hypothetical protein
MSDCSGSLSAVPVLGAEARYSIYGMECFKRAKADGVIVFSVGGSCAMNIFLVFTTETWLV